MTKVHITSEQFFEYIRCPVHYDTTYDRKFTEVNDTTFVKLVQKEWNRFLSNLMNGVVLSAALIKKHWDETCRAYPEVIDEKKIIEGIGLLMLGYKWAEENELRIADIDIPYLLSFKDNDYEVEISGNTLPLAVGKHEKLYYLDSYFGNQVKSNQSEIDMKLKYTLDIYAMQRLYNRKIGVQVHHIKSYHDFYTMRSREDYKRLGRTVLNVGKLIHQRIYYPRESAFCTTCDLLNFCKAWY